MDLAVRDQSGWLIMMDVARSRRSSQAQLLVGRKDSRMGGLVVVVRAVSLVRGHTARGIALGRRGHRIEVSRAVVAVGSMALDVTVVSRQKPAKHMDLISVRC
jgi:hypothetical protein